MGHQDKTVSLQKLTRYIMKQQIHMKISHSHTHTKWFVSQVVHGQPHWKFSKGEQSFMDKIILDFNLKGEGRLANTGNKLDRETPKEMYKVMGNILLSAYYDLGVMLMILHLTLKTTPQVRYSHHPHTY